MEILVRVYSRDGHCVRCCPDAHEPTAWSERVQWQHVESMFNGLPSRLRFGGIYCDANIFLFRRAWQCSLPRSFSLRLGWMRKSTVCARRMDAGTPALGPRSFSSLVDVASRARGLSAAVRRNAPTSSGLLLSTSSTIESAPSISVKPSRVDAQVEFQKEEKNAAAVARSPLLLPWPMP